MMHLCQAVAAHSAPRFTHILHKQHTCSTPARTHVQLLLTQSSCHSWQLHGTRCRTLRQGKAAPTQHALGAHPHDYRNLAGRGGPHTYDRSLSLSPAVDPTMSIKLPATIPHTASAVGAAVCKGTAAAAAAGRGQRNM